MGETIDELTFTLVEKEMLKWLSKKFETSQEAIAREALGRGMRAKFDDITKKRKKK